MQNPIGEADLEWILHRNCEGTEQLQSKNEKESDMENKKVFQYYFTRIEYNVNISSNENYIK